MIQVNTGLRILKRYAPMTGRGEKSQSASRRARKLIAHGGLKTNEGLLLTEKFLTPLNPGSWREVNVNDAAMKNQSLITRTMTNLWKSCGFANRATNNGTKNF